MGSTKKITVLPLLELNANKRTWCAALFLSAMCGLQGCNVGPKYHPPAMPAPSAFKEQGAQQAPDGSIWKTAQPQDTALRGKWWEIYHEPELNGLEEKIIISNLNVAQAFANFTAARAQIGQARSSYYPTISVGPSYTRGRSFQTTTTSFNSTNNPNTNLFNLPFDVSWQPDLWGRVRNTVHQFSYAAQVSAADLANLTLTEQANLAIFYFELRGQDALEELYQETVEADRQSLALTRIQYRTGLANDEAVAQAEIALKSAEASATNAGIARAQYEHAIALLIGVAASSFSIPIQSLRPRFRAYRWESLLHYWRGALISLPRNGPMAEANALIGVEKAAYYPTLSLSGAAGLETTKFSKWMTSPSRYWSVEPTAAETIFDGGLKKSTVAQYKALYDADVANYRQVVLTAFQQTEDYLASQRLLKEQIAQQQETVQSAQRYLDVASARYRTGLDPYLNVFTAQTTLLLNQQAVITLRVQQMSSSVQLIEALGGGWNVSQLPTEREVSANRPK
jgi:outer membrane protein TolC